MQEQKSLLANALLSHEPINIDYLESVPNYGTVPALPIAHQEQTTHWIKKLLRGLHGTIEFVAEPLEGAVLGYTTYLLYAYNPKNETKYGYGVLGLEACIFASVEALEITHRLSKDKYEIFRLLKLAMAGALDSANFLQSFMPTNNRGVMGGGAVFVSFTSMKFLVEHYRHKPFLRSKTGLVIKYSSDIVYYTAMGAGISALLQQLYSGLASNPPPAVSWPITGAFAITTLAANLVKKHDANRAEISVAYRTAHVISALLYAVSIGAFSMTLALDIISDIVKSGDIKDRWFYESLAAALALSTVVAYKKIALDIKEEHRHHHQTDVALLQSVGINGDDEQAPQEPATSSNLFYNLYSQAKNYCAGFWPNSNTAQNRRICDLLPTESLTSWQEQCSANRWWPFSSKPATTLIAPLPVDDDNPNDLPYMKRSHA